jgi:5-formyltetrahydrofolate cyclo-ligase
MMKEKNVLRSELLAKRAQMTPHEVWRSSRSIFGSLIRESVFQKAGSICCYLSFDNEVHTHGFVLHCLKAGKTVAIPKTDKKQGILLSKFISFNHLSPGPFGILEPKENSYFPYDPDELDLAVVPAVALDREGNRLGFGTGYYDKFLAKRNKRLFLVGVVHSFQLLQQLPVSSYDVPVQQVITDGANICLEGTEVSGNLDSLKAM